MTTYKVQITCSSEVERNIIADIIKNHDLISTMYSQEIKNDKIDCKYLTVLDETLTDNLYASLTGRKIELNY